MIHVVTPFSRPENLDALRVVLDVPGITWHRLIYAPVPDGLDGCYWKLNRFVESHPIVADELYWFMCDDDMPGPGLLDALAAIDVSINVIFITALRGHHDTRHPCTTLTARSDWGVGIQQIVVRGSVLTRMRFRENDPQADVAMGWWLRKRYACSYRPDLCVLFNRLEPGRWD